MDSGTSGIFKDTAHGTESLETFFFVNVDKTIAGSYSSSGLKIKTIVTIANGDVPAVVGFPVVDVFVKGVVVVVAKVGIVVVVGGSAAVFMVLASIGVGLDPVLKRPRYDSVHPDRGFRDQSGVKMSTEKRQRNADRKSVV